MPTLSVEGSVFQADSLSRKELVQFAPWGDYENIVVSPNNEVLAGVTNDIIYFDPIGSRAFMFHLQEGSVILRLGLQDTPPMGSVTLTNHRLVTTGTYILFGTVSLRNAAVEGISTSSLYDWVGGY